MMIRLILQADYGLNWLQRTSRLKVMFMQQLKARLKKTRFFIYIFNLTLEAIFSIYVSASKLY